MALKDIFMYAYLEEEVERMKQEIEERKYELGDGLVKAGGLTEDLLWELYNIRDLENLVNETEKEMREIY